MFVTFSAPTTEALTAKYCNQFSSLFHFTTTRTSNLRMPAYLSTNIHLWISAHLDYKIPGVIEQEVRKQNMEFLHNRIQFSNEYFDFIRKLVTVNINIHSVSRK